MRKGVLVLLLSLIYLGLSACGNAEGGNEKLDYDQTKKMIVDILKTDEGKKAIQDVMADQEIKQQLILDQNVVKETIETTLTSKKGEDFWKKAFEDPKFAESVAKSMKTEHEELLKDLMKDPEYQELMMDILKDPENQKEFTNALKSKEFRQHLQKVMIETFDSPLYKAKIQDILLKAAEESGSKSSKEGGSEGDGGEGGQ